MAKSREALEEECSQAQAKLAAAKNELSDFYKNHGSLAPPPGSHAARVHGFIVGKINSLEAEVSSLREQLAALK